MKSTSPTPLQLTAQCALLDIEGTVADIRFVYDVMFPFVRHHLHGFLNERWNDDQVRLAIGQLTTDSGSSSDPTIAWAIGAVERLMDEDSKTTGLKALQGLIWESGFRDGSLRAEVFDDVLPALLLWRSHGIDIRIYSSGSILAQRLFFGHTTQGDMLPLFSAHYDTTIGGKRDAISYSRIATDCELDPAHIVFLSDVAAELDAANAAGMQAIGCVRPNNAPLPDSYCGPTIRSFSDLELFVPKS